MTRSVLKQMPFYPALREAASGARRLPETLKFAVRGRPAPGDAIVLACSGRSGSTWLADLLSAAPGVQQIFEPLHPETNAEVRKLVGWNASAGESYVRVYLRPGEAHAAWQALLGRVLSGRVRNFRTDYHRTTFFPDRFLVKDIRFNLMLGFLYDAFRPPIVLMLRHPCAVVHSRLRKVRTPWYASVDDLLKQEALVEDYLRPWVGQIERERDLLGAHAVWWAVENRVALSDLATRPHHLLLYESLVLEPEAQLRELCDWLQLPPIVLASDQIRRDSRVTTQPNAAPPADGVARLSSWQKGLSADEQKRILTWAERFELPWYGPEPLPREFR